MYLLRSCLSWSLCISIGLAVCLSGCTHKSEVGDNGGGTPGVEPAESPAKVAGDEPEIQPDIELSSDAKKLAGIEIGAAEEKLLSFSVKTTGEVTANANLLTHVTTPVTGRVTEVLVNIGDRIQDGNPLLM